MLYKMRNIIAGTTIAKNEIKYALNVYRVVIVIYFRNSQ